MVPGSTLMYGSNLRRVTLRPRLSRRYPMDAAANPLPREDRTPPVTKIYFVIAPPPLRTTHPLPPARRDHLLYPHQVRGGVHTPALAFCFPDTNTVTRTQRP